MKKRPLTNHNLRRGITLIELTVVIAIILLLLSILIFAGRYYFENANRSACITNINGMHKAIRTTQNIDHLETGSALASTDIIGPGKALDVMPTCPKGKGGYIFADEIAPTGTVMVFCEDYDPAIGARDTNSDHAPGNTLTW